MGDAVKVPLSESVSFDAGPYDRISSSLQVEPLIPLQIARNWLLIPRISATPVAYQPDVTRAGGGTTGIGDTVATFFITPAHTGKLIWGVGPSLLNPTATNPNIGGGKWDFGASLAVIAQPSWGSAYLVVQNIRSLPGNSRGTSVDLVQIGQVSSHPPEDQIGHQLEMHFVVVRRRGLLSRRRHPGSGKQSDDNCEFVQHPA